MSAPYFIYGIVLFGLGMLAGIFVARQRRKEEVNTSRDNTIPDRDQPDHSVTSENEGFSGAVPSETVGRSPDHERHPGSKILPDEASGKGTSSERNKEDILLIVEDNVDMNNFISEQFENDYDILRAYNGEEGTRLAIEHIPDLIISDLMMPVRDGLELCNILKNDEITSHIPIILLTAKATVENRIQGLETGADDYIAKPYNPDELIVRARNLLEQRERLRKKYANMIGMDWGEMSVTTLDEEFLKKITATVTKHIDDFEFDVMSLQDKMAMSRGHLHRKLKALTGESPSSLIRVMRMKAAASMIEKGVDSITEISMNVGFSNPSHFAQCFKEQYGMSPRDYRNKF